MSTIDANRLAELYPQNDIRILVGCAPCQPFSKYTQRYRKEGYMDDKWRLLYAFSRLIESLHPRVISMENVPELAKEQVFDDFINDLANRGYH